MDTNGRMDRVESDLAQLTGVVKTLAESTVRLVEKSGQHDEQIQTIAGATRVLIEKSDRHDEQIQHLNEQFDKVYQLSQKNEEHLGILMGMMDEWIRSRGREKE